MPVPTSPPRIDDKPWVVGGAITVAAWLIFLFRVTVPAQIVFDEVHYVRAAHALLALSGPENIEHPLLGKEAIALGIWLFGDTPFGWRFFSTVAGAATIAGVFALGRLLTRTTRGGVLAATLALLGFTVYVQARIAMLDTFMLPFLVWGIALLGQSMTTGSAARWSAGAMMLGLATACKWAAAPYVGAAAIGYLGMRRGRPDRWPGLNPPLALGLLGGISVLAYAATFAPAFFYAHDAMTWRGLIPFQYEMYLRQTQVLPPHTYQSNWRTWPLMIRPIWYLYEPVAGVQRGILMIGNPAVMWGGLVAVAACYAGWVRNGAARLLAAAALWTFAVGIFAVIPKSLGFYYYYYPASVFLAVVLAVALEQWRARLGGWIELYLALAATLTLYFLPVLSAEPLAHAGAFRRWTWFASWV
ncbi:glycosyltransferase family 39 protein [Sphingomonas sp.]|uniref:glycosyltransferase family 39 protein n=1 Tax=Sphingomonas sp. TaxID=28214 RepID=UPI0035C7C9C9